MEFPEKPRRWEDIYEEIYALRKKDLPYSNIIGTMCARPERNLMKIYMDFLETNLGDPAKFSGTGEVEKRLIEMVLNFFNAPKQADGRVVSGGTEGNLLAVAIAKNMGEGDELLIPDHAHFSFKKIEKIMGVRLKILDTTPNHVIDPANLSRNIGSRTFGVVAVAGTTEFGYIDPIPEISDICYDNNIHLHVDAAFGGFIIPFLKELGYDLPDFDMRLKGVSTLSVDGHKMGGCAIPLGFIIAREKRWFRSIEVDTPYVSTEHQSTLLGTRSGGPVAYGYAKFNLAGREGFMKIAERCMQLTKYAKEKLEEEGFMVINKPVTNVLAVRVENLDHIVKKLHDRGWGVNPIKRFSAFRMVLQPHLDEQIIDKFIGDLKCTCEEVYRNEPA